MFFWGGGSGHEMMDSWISICAVYPCASFLSVQNSKFCLKGVLHACQFNLFLSWQCNMTLGLLCDVRFPGSEFTWNAVNDVTDVDVLSQASIFVSTHQQCESQAYNINNGDLFRWKDVSASTSS